GLLIHCSLHIVRFHQKPDHVAVVEEHAGQWGNMHFRNRLPGSARHGQADGLGDMIPARLERMKCNCLVQQWHGHVPIRTRCKTYTKRSQHVPMTGIERQGLPGSCFKMVELPTMKSYNGQSLLGGCAFGVTRHSSLCL